MITLSLILTQFIFRLSFGVAIAMGVTPPKLVTSGFYRVHLWVLMGLNTLASLAVFSSVEEDYPNRSIVFGLAIIAAVLSFVGSVVWLYEKPRAGILVLYLVALASLLAAGLATKLPEIVSDRGAALVILDLVSGGLLLGVTLSAMLLGHWYLNTPTMKLVPLQRLVLFMAGAIIARTILCAIGLSIHIQDQGSPDATMWAFITLRWLSGLLGTLMLAWLTWNTLKIPNTQSATGILYAGVILAFVGELVSQLLSVGELYPL